ncbi:MULTISPECIES: cytochrome-c oxidase, cbb3-type subunit III [Alteromonadaceae]|uniref:cytochrome-c oxidase, cbb3-type subunit III n=1 Tax=Alteromonadaceae TaxID=72275 RepID=UPI001C0945C7|nr:MULTISPECIES: cytochrome-c oxidase, cbb3-type subunit III [Aliiglaciecola]MBU2876351.1 cytochrome-c oxidase, cbb3-type subunit III [Aliiglaciecola lipolytica]MDO6710567.1 cytochrome-c oxidase, cbb3-type subunit III [Aliiglaciecola sp. 2_MG-2023]MDO6751568.1 cytochrome-c oxidase, cbb3-type subunit III [Aliiglaciecola sp. 1_MG-2023]
MSSFWSIWVSVISLGTILGCYLILRWCLLNKTGVEEGDDMHHSFDGIIEINNPLPKWWTIMFYMTMIWGILYLLLYPGLGNWKGLLGWKSSNQDIQTLQESKDAVLASREEAKNALFGLGGVGVEYDRELEKAEEKFAPIFNQYAEQPIEVLVNNEEALKIGQRLFMQNCSQCHGSDARGQRGFPNLTDHDWLYGGTPEKIVETLTNGRQANMAAWLPSFGEQGVKEVVAYALSLSGRQVDPDLKEAGKVRFAVCSACHGADGKGNQALGAPNLTDNIWLYGGSTDVVTETVNYGRAGVMPSFKNTLGEKKIHLVATYVYSLSKDK